MNSLKDILYRMIHEVMHILWEIILGFIVKNVGINSDPIINN